LKDFGSYNVQKTYYTNLILPPMAPLPHVSLKDPLKGYGNVERSVRRGTRCYLHQLMSSENMVLYYALDD